MLQTKLIAGLGNPGAEYEWTRHNLGFLVVSRFVEDAKASFSSSRCCRGLEAQFRLGEVKVVVLMPMTYMNLSGQAVAGALSYYKVEPAESLVVCDDFSLEFGQLRLRSKGSDGGHNGLKSIIENLGTQDFMRLRLGVGNPPSRQDPADYVLSAFSAEERRELDAIISEASDCCRAWVEETDIEKVMSQFNKRKDNE
ncbi:MAG TPA: aminoacyl-tRNA hydrolase [Candidatus Omnitrophota bacterium]|nr:aminoacyl-tRNA hydrolase [Candidatus Omnitrophota bacterium]